MADPSSKDQQIHQRCCQYVDNRGQTGQTQRLSQNLQKRPCVNRHSVQGQKILPTTLLARGCLKTAGSSVVDAKIPDTKNVRSRTSFKRVMIENVNPNSILVATTDEPIMFTGPQVKRTSDYGNREEQNRCASSPNFVFNCAPGPTCIRKTAAMNTKQDTPITGSGRGARSGYKGR